MQRTRTLFVVACLTALATPAMAATYYVATTGLDSAAGTGDKPFRTMAKAVTVLRPGDTLLVQPGTYAENINFLVPSGTSWSAAVTIKAANPQSRPVLRTPTGHWVLYFSNGAKYIVLDGLVLDGSNVVSDGLKITTSAHHVRVINTEIKNAPIQGVLTTDGAYANEFINLDVHDNGTTDFDHGLYISSHGNLVSNCRVYRNAGWGIHIYNGAANNASNNVIRNNLVQDNARVGARGDGILLASGAGNMAYNNIVRGNQVGVWVDYGASNSAVYHNVVFSNRGEFAVYVGPDASSTLVRNNIVYGNTANSIENRGQYTKMSKNLVGVDPKFVAPASGDFRLKAGSPGIDTGVKTSVTADIVGNRRPLGAAVDIGAYETQR